MGTGFSWPAGEPGCGVMKCPCSGHVPLLRDWQGLPVALSPVSGKDAGGSGAGGRQWGPWWLAWPEAAGRPTPPARRPRLRCPRRSLQRSLNCAFRSALPDCSVPRAAAVLTLVTSAFSQTLPRDCQRLPRAPGCCPPAGPGRPSS